MTADAEPQGTYRLPSSLADDLEGLRQMAEQVQAGTLAPERFRAFRVPMGVYEQRENGTFMLRVRVPEPPAAEPSGLTEDFRGVACPLNYVKAKIALEAMEPGQVLTLVLGKEGAQNVPASAAADGHKVLSLTQEGDHWRLVIQKG